jgi:hypothetical protein
MIKKEFKVLSKESGFKRNFKSNQRGFTTVEFLFAFVIAFGLTMLTFALTTTLSIVEMTQYIVYSASRAHSAANYDVDAQQEAARQKYASLVNSATMAPLYQNGWFEVSAANQLDIRSGDGRNFEREYGGNNPRKNLQGVRTNLRVKILEMQWPLIGSVKPEDEDAGFITRINAILIREVSHSECLQYMEQRKNDMWTFDGQNRFVRFRRTADLPTPWEDNGC